jgi:ribosomal protein S17
MKVVQGGECKLSYLMRKEDVPVKVKIDGEKNTVLMARLYVGRVATGAYKKSELISLNRYEFRGKYQKMVCNVSDRIYFVIEGKITNFRVKDEVYAEVKKGDIVFIPKGTPYSWDWGECEYMVMNGPAFVSGSDKILT